METTKEQIQKYISGLKFSDKPLRMATRISGGCQIIRLQSGSYVHINYDYDPADGIALFTKVDYEREPIEGDSWIHVPTLTIAKFAIASFE